jgi:hypothetical protein
MYSPERSSISESSYTVYVLYSRHHLLESANDMDLQIHALESVPDASIEA